MSVSKTHAQFGPAPDGAIVVMDRGSTNGTMLMRQGVSRQLAPGKPATLVDGDKVVFGDREMLISREALSQQRLRRGRMSDVPTFLDLLYDEAPLAAFDEHLAQCEADLGEADAAVVRSEYDVAVRLRDLMGRMRSREAELSALYETASDLTAIRDVDTILAAIVRRARQLLHCDMTYLSLNDEGDGASYMKVTDGALTREFQTLRLPLGTGLLGLVAQTGAAYFTEDYASDERFVHQGYIDEAVAGEQIRAILGVPLVLDGVVIGALLAVHRSVRRFPQSEVSLLTSFAAHAVVALENARLFVELDEANRSLTRHTEAVDAAALAHDRLTDLLIGGGGVAEVAEVLSGVLHGAVSVWTPTGELLAGDDAPQARPDAVPEAVAEAVTSGRSVATGSGLVAAALARTEHVATLVLRRDEPLDLAGRRTLERGALVTALVLLFARSVTDAEERLGGQLLADLLESDPDSRERLRDRVRRHSASLDGPVVVAAATVDGADRHRASRAAVALARRSSGLAGEHRGAVVVVVPSEDPRRVGVDLQAAVAEPGEWRPSASPARATRSTLTGWSRPTTRRAAASTRWSASGAAAP